MTNSRKFLQHYGTSGRQEMTLAFKTKLGLFCRYIMQWQRTLKSLLLQRKQIIVKTKTFQLLPKSIQLLDAPMNSNKPCSLICVHTDVSTVICASSASWNSGDPNKQVILCYLQEQQLMRATCRPEYYYKPTVYGKPYTCTTLLQIAITRANSRVKNLH